MTSGDEWRLRELLSEASVAAAAGDADAAVAGVRRRVRRRRAARSVIAGVAVVAVGAGAALAATGSSRPGSTVPMPSYRLAGAVRSFTGCSSYLHYAKHRAERMVGPYGLGTPPLVSSAYYDAASGAGAATGSVLHAPVALPDEKTVVAHSGTTDQVPGVDEPDTVKTDGRVVVTLTGSTLRVLDLQAKVLGSVQVPGNTGGGLLLDGDRVVVLSATSNSQVSQATPYWSPTDIGFAATPTRPPARAAVVDISDPSRPQLIRTFRFDGSLVGVRQVGGVVHLVLGTAAPRIAFQTPQRAGSPRAARRENRRLIAHSTLADWLPWWQSVAPDGSSTGRQQLASCDAVARPVHPTGIATVSVFGLDPAATAPGAATSVVAGGDIVYETADHLYLAGEKSTTPPVRCLASMRCPIARAHTHSTRADTHSTRRQRPPGPRTRIYEFDTTGSRPTFLAAGQMRGTLLDSYALDEDSQGYLRVAATVEGRDGKPHSRVLVMQRSGQDLMHIGVVGRLARGQTVRAVRFLGDLAYVVTFRSYDPMFVIDLRDPGDPRVSGTLEQPGFSEFLYPLSSTRLIGVGVEIARNEPAALLVSTYDVSDPHHPQRLAASPLAHGFFASAQPYDPHAFLSWPAAHLVVVSLPAGAGRRGSGAVAYRVGVDGSLTRLATLSHDGLAPTRSVVIGNQLWALTSEGVLVSSLADLHAAPTWHAY